MSYDQKTTTAIMQLVTIADHNASLPHSGAVAQFIEENDIKSKYGAQETKDKAKELNIPCSKGGK